jgi:hypothetical protein
VRGRSFDPTYSRERARAASPAQLLRPRASLGAWHVLHTDPALGGSASPTLRASRLRTGVARTATGASTRAARARPLARRVAAEETLTPRIPRCVLPRSSRIGQTYCLTSLGRPLLSPLRSDSPAFGSSGRRALHAQLTAGAFARLSACSCAGMTAEEAEEAEVTRSRRNRRIFRRDLRLHDPYTLGMRPATENRDFEKSSLTRLPTTPGPPHRKARSQP